jgi:acetylornithine deacetylase/succinyl-diaminopimelate desuccinylase-like protein
MLNLTSSMAVAVRTLADSGFRPRGTLTYLAVADEEALGTWGAHHLVDHEWDAVRADYVITESGGIPIPSSSGLKLPVMVGEKGCYWSTITVRGTPGHGSQPWRTDNALVKAAEVVRRIAGYAPATDINDVWRRFVAGVDLPEDLSRALLSRDDFMGAIEGLPMGIARQFHACTHTTFSPNIVHGGSKINTIPDSVDLQVDIRTLPGQTAEDVEAQLLDAVGDLADDVTFTASAYDAASASPIDTPLWDVLTRASARFYEDSQTVPMLIVGATDARFFRRLGATAYGYGLFSRNLSFEDYSTMFHGDDERVDQESLGLSTELWQVVARELLG